MVLPGAFFKSEPEELLQSNAHQLRMCTSVPVNLEKLPIKNVSFYFYYGGLFLRIIIEARNGK